MSRIAQGERPLQPHPGGRQLPPDHGAIRRVPEADLPALRVRRADTTISLADGESFVISGLVSRTMRDSANKMPMLGDIPVLGAFFRSTSFDSVESELLMIVTARLVKPRAAGAPQPQLPGGKAKRGPWVT